MYTNRLVCEKKGRHGGYDERDGLLRSIGTGALL